MVIAHTSPDTPLFCRTTRHATQVGKNGTSGRDNCQHRLKYKKKKQQPASTPSALFLKAITAVQPDTRPKWQKIELVGGTIVNTPVDKYDMTGKPENAIGYHSTNLEKKYTTKLIYSAWRPESHRGM